MRSFFLFPLLHFFFPIVSTQDRNLETVKEAFDDANIPADADINFNPRLLLEVSFPQSSGPPVLIHAGETVPRNETVGPAEFSIGSTSLARGPLVVAMIDLDAPTPQQPNSSEIRHFLGANFHETGTGRLVNSTPAISGFLQPTPPAGSDPHRYVFLLFDQPADFNTKSPMFVNASTSVSNWSLSQFVAEVGLGDPLGGSFMRVGPDPSTS